MTIKKTLLILVLLVVVAGTVTTLAKLQTIEPQKQDNRQKEEPTILKDTSRSVRQSEHGKLFRHSGRQLLDLAAKQAGDVEVMEELGYVIQMPNSTREVPTFQSALCKANAVVIGTVQTKTSALTEQGNFIFTDYDVTVDEVIKNNASSPIAVGSTIVTTRDGGAIALNQRIFRATRADFNPPLIGNRYLLFLRFIPQTGSYLMYGNGSFELQSDTIRALGPEAREELHHRANQDPLTFLTELRAFAQRTCSNN